MRGDIKELELNTHSVVDLLKRSQPWRSQHAKGRKLRAIARQRKRWAKKQSIKRYKY